MTTSENTGSTQVPAKSGWLRRAVMGTAFAAVGLVALGGGSTPAQAWWYGGYGYGPYYSYYYPHYYGWYGYHRAYWGPGWGWHRNWGWRHHW